MNQEQDQTIQEVEKLLQSMSLKKPDFALGQRLGFAPNRFDRNKLREFMIALACLLSGVFIGRWMPVNDENEPPVKAVASSNSSVAEIKLAHQSGRGQAKSGTDSAVKLIDEGLYFMDGKIPVRKYTSISQQDITVVDPETGKPVTIKVPVKKTVVATAVGT